MPKRNYGQREPHYPAAEATVSWLQQKIWEYPLNRWSRLVAAYLLVRTDGPRIGRFSRDYVIAVVARRDFGDERGGDGDDHAGRP